MSSIFLGSAADTFPEYATAGHLRRLFLKSAKPSAAGYDRVTHETFAKRLVFHTSIMSRKVTQGSYAFTPYREKLVAKKAQSIPRLISVPTVRDRLLLASLKEFLHYQGPAGVTRDLPSAHVRKLVGFLQSNASDRIRIIQLDIESFFPSVTHDKLLSRVKTLIACGEANRLVASALATPTLPIGTSRVGRFNATSSSGIPQGLPISNYLAHVYLLDFDSALQRHCLFYTRFVDDLLLLVDKDQVNDSHELVERELSSLGLRLNEEKTSIITLAEAFDFLGYTIKWPIVSVRRENQQRYLTSVARFFLTYRKRRSEGAFPKWLRTKARKSAFVLDLNERVTGAISGRRRYGWLFYFSELNDIALLRQMDRVIAGYFRRLKDFGGRAPPELKRLVRAHYESRFSPSSGYIHDYNALATIKGKVAYLVARGEVSRAAAQNLTPEQVEERFALARNRRLAGLDLDVSYIY